MTSTVNGTAISMAGLSAATLSSTPIPDTSHTTTLAEHTMPSQRHWPFNDLVLALQQQHCEHVARRALPLWDYPEDATLRLLNLTENATFRVDAPGHAPIIMRVHRLDYASRASIQFELDWLLALAKDTNLRLATPIRARDGAYVHTVATPSLNENRNVVVFSFLEGSTPRDSQDDTESMSSLMSALGKIPDSLLAPLVRSASVLFDMNEHHKHGSTMTSNDKALYRTIGEVAAILRVQSSRWADSQPYVHERISWDWDATFSKGWNNYYGAHYWDLNSTLTRHDIETIERCSIIMHHRLEAFGTGTDHYGLIHSDLRPGNLLVADGTSATSLLARMGILDFDDCGMGWYMTEIAGIVGFQEHRGDLDEVIQSIVEGYRMHWDLDEQEVAEIPTFVMMRRIGLTQALMYHLTNAAPGSNEAADITPALLQFYAKGTVQLAKRYIKRFKETL